MKWIILYGLISLSYGKYSIFILGIFFQKYCLSLILLIKRLKMYSGPIKLRNRMTTSRLILNTLLNLRRSAHTKQLLFRLKVQDFSSINERTLSDTSRVTQSFVDTLFKQSVFRVTNRCTRMCGQPCTLWYFSAGTPNFQEI